MRKHFSHKKLNAVIPSLVLSNNVNLKPVLNSPDIESVSNGNSKRLAIWL